MGPHKNTGNFFNRHMARLPWLLLLSRSSTALVGQARRFRELRKAAPLYARRDAAAAAVASMVAATTLAFGAPCAAWAGDGSLTEPQHLVAEAWRQVIEICTSSALAYSALALH